MYKRIDLEKELPTIQVPSIHNYEIEDIDERMVSLKEQGFIVESQYWNQGIPGVYKDCYVR